MNSRSLAFGLVAAVALLLDWAVFAVREVLVRDHVLEGDSEAVHMGVLVQMAAEGEEDVLHHQVIVLFLYYRIQQALEISLQCIWCRF